MRHFLFILCCLAMIFYQTPPDTEQPGGLSVAAVSGSIPVSGRILSEGEGNFHRYVSGLGVGNQNVLELAAGANGQISYIHESPAGPGISGRFRVKFLSTQGTGRVLLEALDSEQKPVASVIWLVTGQAPSGSKNAVIDKRLAANFKGESLEAEWSANDILCNMTGIKQIKADKYRLSIIAGQGQHALVVDAGFTANIYGSIRVATQHKQLVASLGDKLTIMAEFENISRQNLPPFKAGIWGPEAFGLLIEGESEHEISGLAPGAKVKLVWNVKAQRPDLVNGGKPWPLFFTVDGKPQGASVTVKVPDSRPGKIFYVMTEDLEPIDSAGYAKAWGNADGWLNPEELRIQMIGKSEKINEIAELYGAKWTHYIAWPAVRAAEWAAARSKNSDWRSVVDDIRQSVIQESRKGHEYALHLHSDYDPDLADNVLSYNPATDGFWGNHRRHGWAHSIVREGDFDIHDSRTGMLYYYQRILDELTQDSGQGQILTARAGSFDFGDGPVDEAMSTRAYRRVGLWGSSDADGNTGRLTAAPFGKEIYFARVDDINKPAESLSSAGLVEFRPTPKDLIMYDSNTAAVMNAKTDLGVAAFTENGEVKPGVHAIIGFTHAMFIMGQGDWRSLEGGQFDQLRDHLSYVKVKYADENILHFATASQLVAEYLDYFSPKPVAVYGEKIASGIGEAEFVIKLLGKDIPISNNYPHLIKVKIPLYLRDSAFFAQVLKNGDPIYSTWEPAADNNDIPFIANDRNAVYTLRVYYDDQIAALRQKAWQWWQSLQ